MDDVFNLTLEQQCEREAEQREAERADSEQQYQQALEEERKEHERVSCKPSLTHAYMYLLHNVTPVLEYQTLNNYVFV